MQIGNFALHVLVGGRPAREYGHDGRTYVPGAAGREYTLRLGNRSGRRVKVVLAVDGLSVVDGKPAARDGSGYVVDPFTSLDVPGWRVSDADVARFVFGEAEASYAAARGKGERAGVVTALFYDEQEARAAPPAPTGPGVSVRPGGVTRGAAPGAAGGTLGTAFGGRTDHAVRKVEFCARPRPAAEIEVRYEDVAILRGFGLDVDDEPADLHAPGAAAPDAAYCQPPRDWRG